MTDRAEIERLLNQTGRTLEGLLNSYSVQEVDNRCESDLISRSAVIDRIAEFLGPKGLDEWEVMVAIREIIENAPAVDAVLVDRLGDFGKLFMEYKGCPRGAMGRMGGTPIEEEALYMKPITDVDGGRWIPVNADALHELVSEYKKRVPVVHARWVHSWLESKCSACGYLSKSDRVTHVRNDTKYCPNCGARMDEEEDTNGHQTD